MARQTRGHGRLIASIPFEQVLASLTRSRGGKVLYDQEPSQEQRAPKGRSPTYSVKGERASKGPLMPQKRGGWGSTKRLEWAQVKQIDHTAHAARRARQPLNVHLTIRAPADAPDSEGKRFIAKTVGHIGEGVKRRGQDHVGITVYEKDPYLHAHHVLHVRPENDDVIARFADGDIIHATPADWETIPYITK